jgi:CheY-like chemotaxis protein
MDMNLYVAKGMLSPYGLQIDTALSGPEAIEKIKRSEYDLVFMDHMMPKMDGMEATQEIRKLGGVYEKLPIVALTANAVAGMKEMFLSNGFNGFISKPIVMRELDNVIREWLSPEKLSERSEADGAANAGSDIDSFIEEVSKIEEINTEIGLNRFPGMKDLYHTSLEMFYKKLPVECDNMTGLIDARDMENFSISVHSMKSLLATVGAMRLSEAAFELESASKNRETNYCLKKFPQFRENLLSLHAKLSVIFPEAETAQKKKPGDMSRLLEDVKKALAAAENFDNDTGISIIKNLLPFDFGGENNVLLEDALSALENFEYEGAAAILGKIR